VLSFPSFYRLVRRTDAPVADEKRAHFRDDFEVEIRLGA
jgi:hypothetical protein